MKPIFLERKVPYARRRRITHVETEPECPTFWGYARVSDPKQEGNTSTETQPELIKKEFAKNWSETHEMGQIVSDVKSASKFRFDQRDGGKKLLGLMKKGDTLAITKVDRFSRTIVDGLQEMRDIWRKGITVVCLDIGNYKITFDTMTGQIYFFMLLFAAEQETNRRRERASEAWAKQKENGVLPSRKKMGMPVKYGKRRVGSKWIPAPEHREFVRKLMALYLFSVETFGFTKCDARHRWFAERYDLLWWNGYLYRGPDGPREVICEERYLRWFEREVQAQERDRAEGKEIPPVDEPWRRDYVAGVLTAPTHPGLPAWVIPLNKPGD